VHCWLIWRKAHEAASDYPSLEKTISSGNPLSGCNPIVERPIKVSPRSKHMHKPTAREFPSPFRSLRVPCFRATART